MYIPRPILYILALVLLFMLSFVFAKRRNKLYIKNKVLLPYYYAIHNYIEPYLSSEFGKFIDNCSIEQLNYIFIKKESNNFDYQQIIDKVNDNSFVYQFSWLCILFCIKSHKPTLQLSSEEQYAKNSLAEHITYIIQEEQDSVPDILWDFFGEYLDKKSFLAKKTESKSSPKKATAQNQEYENNIAQLQEKLSKQEMEIEFSKTEFAQYIEALQRIENTLINLNHSSRIKDCTTIADIILQNDLSIPCEGFILTDTIKEIIEDKKI